MVNLTPIRCAWADWNVDTQDSCSLKARGARPNEFRHDPVTGRSGPGFEKPGAALHMLHKFFELHLAALAGFQVFKKDNLIELL